MPAPNNPARPSIQARLAAEQPASSPIAPAAPVVATGEPPLVLNPPDSGPLLNERPQVVHDLGEADHDWTAIDSQRLSTLNEALLAYRAMLLASRSRQEQSSALNPSSTADVIHSIELGIARAEQLATEIQQAIAGD